MLTAAELDTQLTRATASLSRGELAQAESMCRGVLAAAPNNAAALHLLGLVRARGGDRRGGEELLRRSVELEPADSRLRLNLATFLRRAGRLEEAERVYRRVLQLAPGERGARHGLVLTLNNLGHSREAEIQCRTLIDSDRASPDGWAALGSLLASQNRLLEAEGAYRQALALNPANAPLHRRLGSLLAQLERSEEALALLARAQALGVRGFELELARGRALGQLGRLEEAERAFAAAVQLRPRHGDAQLYLARVRQARGDPDFSRSLAAAALEAGGDLNLQEALAVLLLNAGRGEVAEELLREELKRAGPVPRLRYVLSRIMREAERLAEAETEALEAAAALPDDAGVVENLVSILLSRGRPTEALAFIRAQRTRMPGAQGWIAYEAVAARLLGQPLYGELYDYQRLVRRYELQPPPGFASMVELNAALLPVLTARYRANTYPLGESLRNGRITTRNLVMDPDPAIRSLLRAFEEPLRAYLGTLGRDPGHPLSARNQGAVQIVSAWSVQLTRGGFHVNHFHNLGWLSSAYYVQVPEEAGDPELKSGWLRLGEPQFPTPGAGVGCVVQPHAGQLVLFPSYMWHGTSPILGAQPRTAVSFDALPAGGG
ncbi:MAG TPA: tetratricopeptide repeat protein [Steroidobacteraceae bacterium]|nr:tetratricopeptide repeat protein [Steroidobacteraceae bacterium]